MPRPPSPPEDGPALREGLVAAVVGLAVVAALVRFGAGPGRAAPAPSATAVVTAPAAAPASAPSAVAAPRSTRLPYSPCRPPDPIGLGPWSPWEPLGAGEILIPQRGGHDATHGYDVLVHFHGHEALRKTVVQVSRGVVLVGFDLGVGSSAYARAYPGRTAWEELRSEIAAALRRRHPDAHVRNLGLSAWSAGFGAVGQILRHGAPEVSAVVLLDGLHARWKRFQVPAPTADDLSPVGLGPWLRMGRRALAGEAYFAVTHSEIDPVTYPGTAPSAALLLRELGVASRPVDAGDDPYGPTGRAEQGGLRVLGYRGTDAGAHCAHLARFGALLQELEARWDTPALDRDVPFTPAPPRARAGASAGKGGDDALELGAAPSIDPAPFEDDGPPAGSEPGNVDLGGLEEIPLD